MAITTQTAVIGCVLPAAALALVATLYFFSRRKKNDEPKKNDVTASKEKANVAVTTKKENKGENVRKRPVPNGDVGKPITKDDVITPRKGNDVEKKDVSAHRDVVEEIVVKDSAKETNENVILVEDLFKSAKASLEETVRHDVTDGGAVHDEETLREFMTSLMTKTDASTPPWSAEDIITNEEATVVQSTDPSLDGAGDAPLSTAANKVANNNVSNNKKSKEIKKKIEKTKPELAKKEKKKPEVKKGEVKKEEAKVKDEVCDKKELSEQNNHQRSHSESTSEVSSDSGNGNSVVERQSLASPSSNTITCYQFEFPSRLCGKFVGKSGRNINQIKNASGCQITLLQHPYYNPEYQICTLDGTDDEVANALGLIKEKFPQSRFSDITYEPFQVLTQETAHPVISPDLMELTCPMDLRLISGIFNDVVVSSVVDASQIFVHQPAHPTFPSLENLNLNMNACYNQEVTAPTLPTPIEVGVICAAPLLGCWYRAQILAWEEGMTEVDVKYVDYGGYGHVKLDDLKQIRSDFMTIPFQACECYVANIAPLEGEETISLEASALLEELTQGCVLQCEILQYDEMTKVPYVYLYKINGTRTQFINRELVDKGVVRWME